MASAAADFHLWRCLGGWYDVVSIACDTEVHQARLSLGLSNGLCWTATTTASRTNAKQIQMVTRFPMTVMMTQTTMAFLMNVMPV